MNEELSLSPGEMHEISREAGDGMSFVCNVLCGQYKYEDKTEFQLPGDFAAHFQRKDNRTFHFQVSRAGQMIGTLEVTEPSLFLATRPPIETIALKNTNGEVFSFQNVGESDPDVNFQAGNADLFGFVHATQKEVNARRERIKQQELQKQQQEAPKPVSPEVRIDEGVYRNPELKIRGMSYENLTEDQAREALATRPEVQRVLPWLPAEIQRLLGYSAPENTEQEASSEVTAEEFIQHMNAMADLVHAGSLKYFGPDATQLCMNLSVLVTKYIHEVFRFPVVGLYDQSDEQHQNYVRPTTTLFDRQPVYPEFIEKTGRFSLEDCVEVKIGDRKFIVDYNYFYQAQDRAYLTEVLTGQENLGEKQVLIFEVTTEAQRRNLDKLGIITVQYDEFNLDKLPADAKKWYDQKMRNYFMITVGDPIADARYRETLKENTAHYFVGSDSHQTVKEYIGHMSAGALITEGEQVNDLTGRGLNFILDTSHSHRDSVDEHLLLADMLDITEV